MQRIKIKGAIFDMDGTLLDSMFMWETAGETYLRKRGVNPAPGLREVLRPMSLAQSAVYFREEYGLAGSVQEIMDGINGLLVHFYEREAQLKPGVMEALSAMREAGIPLCVATATDRSLVEPALARTGVLSLFQGVFTCGEVGAGKDRPDVFLRAWEELGTERESTWIFEDALFAAETARKAGFPVAVVEDPSADGQRRELLALADLYIRDWRLFCWGRESNLAFLESQ